MNIVLFFLRATFFVFEREKKNVGIHIWLNINVRCFSMWGGGSFLIHARHLPTLSIVIFATTGNYSHTWSAVDLSFKLTALLRPTGTENLRYFSRQRTYKPARNFLQQNTSQLKMQPPSKSGKWPSSAWWMMQSKWFASGYFNGDLYIELTTSLPTNETARIPDKSKKSAVVYKSCPKNTTLNNLVKRWVTLLHEHT